MSITNIGDEGQIDPIIEEVKKVQVTVIEPILRQGEG